MKRAVGVALVLTFAAVVVFVACGVTPDSGTHVVVVDDDGEWLGVVEVRVADDPGERYTGLSDTESLGANEGMLFVYPREGTHTYVMRSMSFPIDIVFVGRDS